MGIVHTLMLGIPKEEVRYAGIETIMRQQHLMISTKPPFFAHIGFIDIFALV